jgi:soluble lytic murein transglycosylase-like protein
MNLLLELFLNPLPNPFRRASRLCMIALSACGAAAHADIYSRTAADGSIALTNVPSDTHYSLLIAERDLPRGYQPAWPISAKALPGRAGKAQYDNMVEQAARQVGLESALLHAVISVESRYDARAVSRKGAAGLMQLMPATARRYAVVDPFDPAQNVQGGARYLRDLLRLFDSDKSLALAAYNAGENAVLRNGKRIPAYRETQDYVPRVLGYYSRYRAGEDAALQ